MTREPDAEREAGSDAGLARELFRLASADNFRDVAGPGAGYPTVDGGRVRPGVFYRSNELQLTDEDVLSLTGLGLTRIHDLRVAEETGAHPDAVVPGATWHGFPVLGIPMEEIASLGSPEAAIDMMERIYAGFVADPDCRAAFGAMFEQLAEPDGPQLFHCTAGKDRTGWAAALLLHLAGVPEEIVLADYLATNELATSSRATYLEIVSSAMGEHLVETYERVLVADEAYLGQAYFAVAASYGSLHAYLTEGLGLGEGALASLRAKLTG
ncbi:tyrosine-protein phosphatase [Nocardioides sp. LS1]|uniref:tyrosine-protein phosphatase n=1 Tax=Nocardioides sp. LS1 TaxID=1027620 RepID=UPI000FFAE515|nr:tyrosine-protein phosphatase [Nocardioides sp. LS1]GCD90369.1 protein-tyrosine-phosphatase [Nocardioides sp. LS1]